MKIREVLRLQSEGRTQREIAASVGSARSTVQECLKRVRAAGLAWPLPEELDEAALQARLYPARTPPPEKAERAKPDFEAVMRELARKHVTRRQLWREYRTHHPEGLKYTAFCVQLRTWRKTLGAQATLTLEHRPGDKLGVDFSGDPAYYVDRATGERIAAPLFVAAWNFSHKIFACATASQSAPDWLTAHADAFEFYGCCPAAVVPDNTKTAVIRACRYDPDLNRAYTDLAEHYSVAVLPARVRRPRDKGGVETGVLMAQRRVLAALRDQVFFSLAELNAAIRTIVEEINAEPFQKREGNRNELFETLERPAAQALPPRRYEYGKWSAVLVHPDYHVQVDKGFYSVPYRLIGQQVQARAQARIVELFQHGKLIAAHPRVERPWQRRTIEAHRPPEHQAYLTLGFDQLMERAQRIGIHTAAVLAKQALSKKHLDEVLRGALGIVRLAEDFSPRALEQACGAALQLGTFSYRAVRDLLVAQGRKSPRRGARVNTPATADLFHENLRGAEYFANKTKH